jgi:hypothetical protein
MFFCALLVISLSYSIPRDVVEAKRDKEADLLDRGKQYQRAIGLFYRKTGRYPAKIEDLENTNGVRFLRKRFTDPMTGNSEWRLVHVVNGVMTDSVVTQPQSVQQGSASGTSGGAAFALPGSGQPQPSGVMPPSTFGAGGSFGPGGGFGPGAGVQGGRGPGGPAVIGGSAGSGPSGGIISGFGSPPGGTGTIGTQIAGVASTSTASSIKLYNGQQKYNQWEFIYDPSRDPVVLSRAVAAAAMQAGGAAGAPGGIGTGVGPGPPSQPGTFFGGQRGGQFGFPQPGFVPQPGMAPRPSQPGPIRP